ncbi:hypothetical protein, conserved [Trypanosoma brucei brucei TREU927]|uniref:Uncharacterized protein n=1 Tax=Trypanosoma brucei brucei (strain 927/4 GUTat10.1) TaxID=185431 RepID=Q580T2_TRYB2|nr:hypothetical protein, conserved [Trypanosoma brucei brucei TREU927]AAX81052.1 hypothetical protein, conserved [Trypanosoma brucei]AAZ10574.1 hypothetical protein, conserved [Trypanosoma brucei brucei TREU927]
MPKVLIPMCSGWVLKSVMLLLLVLITIKSVPEVVAAAQDKSVSLGSREEQIAFWEGEIEKLRSKSLIEAERRYGNAKHELEEAKKNSGWFFVSEVDKARIKRLDEAYRERLAELSVLNKQEEMLLAKLKPLYGIVSQRFMQEQRDTIAQTLRTLQDMSYDQAWYNSLFNIREAESFTDLIIGFAIEWLSTYIFMYPFASLYYAFWSAPWSIYAYSSGPFDIVVGAFAWVASVTFMLLPYLALIGGGYYLTRSRGIHISDMLRSFGARRRRG